MTVWQTFNPLNPKSDQHQISPYNNTAKPLIKIIILKEMIANPRGFDLQMNSPCQYQMKHMEKSMENMDTDVKVLRVKDGGNVTA